MAQITRKTLDDAKVRVAIKCYLDAKGDATASELAEYINRLGIGSMKKVTAGTIGKLMLIACSKQNKAFLSCESVEGNCRRYRLRE